MLRYAFSSHRPISAFTAPASAGSSTGGLRWRATTSASVPSW